MSLDKTGYLTLSRIADRALVLLNGMHARTDKLSVMMDLEYAHADCEMDLHKLETFDDFNFNHDIIGIYNNFNRATLKMENCFSPRCTSQDNTRVYELSDNPEVENNPQPYDK